MQLGERIKRLREDNGMTQEELAKEMNVSRQAVYKWESNKGYPDIENLIQLSDYFEVTLDELIKGDRDFQHQIQVKGDKAFFEGLSDPGFYLGIAFIFFGSSTDYSFSFALLVTGVLLLAFYDDIIGAIKGLIRDLKS